MYTMYSVLYMILGDTDERMNDVIYMVAYRPCMGDLKGNLVGEIVWETVWKF